MVGQPVQRRVFHERAGRQVEPGRPGQPPVQVHRAHRVEAEFEQWAVAGNRRPRRVPEHAGGLAGDERRHRRPVRQRGGRYGAVLGRAVPS
nr:hypothetical protein [Micromonospora inyonensis]